MRSFFERYNIAASWALPYCRWVKTRTRAKSDFILAYLSVKHYPMKNLVRAIIAGIGAKKIGGGKCGCIGTIVVFIILYWLLGYVFDAF